MTFANTEEIKVECRCPECGEEFSQWMHVSAEIWDAEIEVFKYDR